MTVSAQPIAGFIYKGTFPHNLHLEGNRGHLAGRPVEKGR